MAGVTLADYPDMSATLLETVFRMTLDKVKLQRTGGAGVESPPASSPMQQTTPPLSKQRSKSTNLLRTLLILQIGCKANRLLSHMSQQPETPTIIPQPPPIPVAVVSPAVRSTLGKRKSSSDEEEEEKEEEEDIDEAIQGPSTSKASKMDEREGGEEEEEDDDDAFSPAENGSEQSGLITSHINGLNPLSSRYGGSSRWTAGVPVCPIMRPC